MSELVRINKHSLSIKELNRQRLVTFEDIDILHERPEGTAKRNFNKNFNRFTNGKHFFRFADEDLKKLKQSTNFVPSNTKEIILITEKGYLLLVKSFNDDLAWQVQEQLIDRYFRAKEILRQQKLNPQWQETRQQNKANRLRETAEVKNYVQYCEDCGSKNAGTYYSTISTLVNKAVGISQKQRDNASTETLQLITLLENTIRRTLIDEVNKQTEYHEIYYVCKRKVSDIMAVVYLPEYKLLPTGTEG